MKGTSVPPGNKNYCLSMAGAGTCMAETLLLARDFQKSDSWDMVKKHIMEDNLLMLNTAASRQRIGQELIKRLQTLRPEELAFFTNSLEDDTKAMLWISLCRTYPLLYSFSKDVLAARYNNMIPNLPKTVYQSFLEEEKYKHTELADLAQSSEKKIESRIFAMLRDCRLIDANFSITPLYPSLHFLELIRRSAPQDFALFPKAGILL